MATNPFPKAIERIREVGWMRSPTDMHRGPTCIGLATSYALGKLEPHYSGRNVLQDVTRELFGVGIITANDTIIETQEQAIEVLQKASEEWERQYGSGESQTQ